MTIEQLVNGAVRPWLSPDSVAEEWRRVGFPVVTSAELAKCMNCTAPECYDCLSGCTGKPVGRPRKDSKPIDGQMEMA